MSRFLFQEMLNYMVKVEASDLFLNSGLPPSVRVHGRALRQERMLLYCCWVVFCVAVRLLEAHPTPKKTHPSRTIDSNHRA